MEELLNLMLHADETIGEVLSRYGVLTYLILFSIIFIETGLVVVTFFPGDGLLVSAGILAASGELNLSLLILILSFATILGHTSNFMIGWLMGKRFFKKDKPRRNTYLSKAYAFYTKYGGVAIAVSRYIPFMRSFVPFVAGMARMNMVTFTWYNILGGIAWILTYLLLGYLFGEIPWVRENYGLVFSVMLILLSFVVLLSGIRAAIQYFKQKGK